MPMRVIADRHSVVLLVLSVIGAVVGCSGAASRPDPSPTQAVAVSTAKKDHSISPTDSLAISRPSSPSAEASPPGSIWRTELKKYLQRGPQDFIQSVRVRPNFRRGKFFGWLILAYRGPGPIRRGDVVLRVNGQGLERPEQAMKVWDDLSNRSELSVELVRARKHLLLRFPILDRRPL